jgi:glucosyl-3-phosphoglycerate synthase
VTHLLARPLLGRFYPELLALDQPLAGEMAARRALFEKVPFATGYGLEIGLLIDIYREVGLPAIRQVDLECRQNRHRPLDELGPMADAVLETLVARVIDEGRLAGVTAPRDERPPLCAAPRVSALTA